MIIHNDCEVYINRYIIVTVKIVKCFGLQGFLYIFM